MQYNTPELKPSDIDLNLPLHDYQRYIRQFIEDTPFCGLFLDMGLGKTLITLAALYDLNPTGHVLIAAPKTIARSTWQDEIDKWHIPLRTKSFICNENGRKLSKKKRMELYEEMQVAPPTLYFINRDLICDLVANMPVKNGKPVWYFPTVILDESQSFKNHRAERFKALKRVRPAISRLVELSGTPAPKGLMDIWSQIYLLDMGQRLGTNITAYRNYFFYESKYANGFPVDWSPKPGMDEEIHRRISDITISVKNPNLVLPPVTFNDITVHMDEPEEKKYRQFMKDKVIPLTDGTEVVAKNAAILQNKLSQMASGTLYVDDELHYEVIHEKKLDILEHIMDQTGSPILVAYWFNCDRDQICKRIKQAVPFDGSPDMIHKWNAGEIPMMLIHPMSAGFGLNLQDGGHTLVWYTLPWSLEAYLQTNARVARQGQKDPVVIHRLLTKGTVDGKIMHALEMKDMTEKALLDAVTVTISEGGA